MKILSKFLLFLFALVLLIFCANTISFSQTVSQEGQFRGYQRINGAMFVDSSFRLPIRPLAPWAYKNITLPNYGFLQVNPVDSLPYYGKNDVWSRLMFSSDADSSYVPLNRTITINGVSQDLSTDRTYSVGTVTSVTLANGTGISVSGTNPITTSGIITITNTAPDQTVTINNGTGISVSGNYPTFTVTNTSPSSGGTVTSVGLTAGTGVSIGGTSPLTSSGTFTITNTAPDQTVVLNNGSGISITGTYPTFTVTNTSPSSGGTVTSVASADGSITVGNPSTTVDLAVVKSPKWSTARNLAGNSVDGSANVAFSNKFIVQGTSDAGLSAAQFLGSLATGVVKNTTTTGVLSIAVAGTDYTTPSDFETLTNKRITKRITTMVNASSCTPAADSSDIAIQTNTQIIGTLTVNAPSGTPTNGQDLELIFKCTNIQNFLWNSIYASNSSTTLPSASTGGGKTDKIYLEYNSASSKWEVSNVQYGY